MKSANVYLNFKGNCLEAFTFYQSVLGGEFPYIGKFKDMPVQEGCDPLSAEMGEQIMHISLQINEQTVLMGSDTGGDWAPLFQLGNNFSISINAENKEEVDRIFAGLSEGGQVIMPVTTTFWGEYFGMLTDKFGINWMIGFREPGFIGG